MADDPTFASAAVADRADRAAHFAAEQWGLGEVALLRRGGNAVYCSAAHIVRVSPAADNAAAQRRLVGWLAGRGYPVEADAAVLNIDGLDVSLWRRVDTSGMPDPVVLARALRRLHAENADELAAVVGTRLPVMFPAEIDKVRGRLDDPAARAVFDPIGVDACVAALDECIVVLRGSCSDLVVAHGDFQATNLLGGVDGTWIIDWELACLAPRWWDLAKTSMFAARFDPDGRWRDVVDRLLDDYGDVDRMVLQAWTTFALVTTTAGCIAKRDVRPELGEEATRRLRWWAGEPDAPLWQFL
jgi:aminoglycoside phosphotransferase